MCEYSNSGQGEIDPIYGEMKIYVVPYYVDDACTFLFFFFYWSIYLYYDYGGP